MVITLRTSEKTPRVDWYRVTSKGRGRFPEGPHYVEGLQGKKWVKHSLALSAKDSLDLFSNMALTYPGMSWRVVRYSSWRTICVTYNAPL